jgi:hypothetical protein
MPLPQPEREVINDEVISDTVPNYTDVLTNMKSFPFSKRNELLVPVPNINEPIAYFRMIFDD